MRVSFVGELGWEFHCPSPTCVDVYRSIMSSSPEVSNAAYRALDALSAEKGYPHWHAEIRTDDSPLEAGLAFTCKLKTETDFQGRRALEAAKAKGPPSKRKVCFTVEG